jgi:hypothetical protein
VACGYAYDSLDDYEGAELVDGSPTFSRLLLRIARVFGRPALARRITDGPKKEQRLLRLSRLPSQTRHRHPWASETS